MALYDLETARKLVIQAGLKLQDAPCQGTGTQHITLAVIKSRND